LLRDLGLPEHVVELGTVPYRQLHHLYKSCHVYVTPAYAETFAHPVVEAMACGLPVVASDMPVHQEVAGDAAAYFSKFSAEGLAQRVRDVVSAPAIAERMSRDGKVRALSFSWLRHVEQLSGLAESVLRQRSHQRE
jgi:glycosyltransferase involved in cell wall biosynthesis